MKPAFTMLSLIVDEQVDEKREINGLAIHKDSESRSVQELHIKRSRRTMVTKKGNI